MAAAALFREDLAAFRILCCRVAERLLHFSISIMFNLKRFQKNYLERLFSKIQYLQSATFSQRCQCSMVTIQVHVMSCSGIVLLLLVAVLELVFTR